MSVIRAVVRGGCLVVEQPTDLPEGSEVDLLLFDDDDEELDEMQRQALDAAIDEATQSVERGEAIDVEQAMHRLRSITHP